MSNDPPNNEENRTKLCKDLVDHWSIEDLLDYATLKLKEEYEKDDEHFAQAWKDAYGVTEDGKQIFFKKSS